MMNALRNWLAWWSDWLTTVSDQVYYRFLLLVCFVNGLDAADAREAAALTMNAICQQRHMYWLLAEKSRRAEVRRVQMEIAEEIKAKFLPGLKELLVNPAQVVKTRADLEDMREAVRKSGVEVAELMDVIEEVERIMCRANAP